MDNSCDNNKQNLEERLKERKKVRVFVNFGKTIQSLIDDLTEIINENAFDLIKEYITIDDISKARDEYANVLVKDKEQLYSFLNLISTKLVGKDTSIDKLFRIEYTLIKENLKESHIKANVTLDYELEKQMFILPDLDFTNICLTEMGLNPENENINVLKSYIKWLPFQTEKFKKTHKYTNNEYTKEIQARIKHERSLRDKIFDLLYGLDKIPIEWNQSKKKRTKIEEKVNKLYSECSGITDRKALRIITANNESYLYHTLEKIASIWNQNYKNYIINTKNYKNDRLNDSYLDGIVEIKDYVKKPKKNNYKSIHMTLRYCGSLFEVQLRTHDMHMDAETRLAPHETYKDCCYNRREKFMKDNPESVNVYSILGELLKTK
jgi:ppGpp synthetase/RelA/SpoT-type nucleotidyltranferase